MLKCEVCTNKFDEYELVYGKCPFCKGTILTKVKRIKIKRDFSKVLTTSKLFGKI